ncbi:MAG: FtsW/RodA/SpoVE family cell cycle protein, partial [Arenibacterium sp.]
MSYLEYHAKSTPSGFRKILYLNWPLTLLLISVACVGFLQLYSVAGGSWTPWAEPQMKRFGLGLAVMLVVALVPIWFWRNMSVVAYLLSIALLIAVELVGVEGKGAQRWIDLGFMRLQPSELMKVTLVMLLAAYYDWLPSRRTSHPFWVLIPVIMILFPTYLVLRQPDLGTSILLLTAGGGLMFLAGVHWAYFVAVIASVVGLISAVFQSRGTDWQLLKNYQYRRI